MHKFLCVFLGLLLLTGAGCPRRVTRVTPPPVTIPTQPTPLRPGDPATRVERNKKILANAGLPTPEISFVKSEVWFAVTDQSLASMHADNRVPKTVVSKLSNLNGNRYETGDQFAKILGDILTKEELERYRDLILGHARTELKLRSPKDAALKTLAWYLIAFKAKGIENAGKLPPDEQELQRQKIRQTAFQFLDTANLKDSLSFRERSFLFDIKPQIEEERDNATFDWRYERVWAMLWR